MEWAWVEGAARDGDGKSRSCMGELDKELEKIRQKNLRKYFKTTKRKEVVK